MTNVFSTSWRGQSSDHFADLGRIYSLLRASRVRPGKRRATRRLIGLPLVEDHAA
jgi:hypothetical protein